MWCGSKAEEEKADHSSVSNMSCCGENVNVLAFEQYYIMYTNFSISTEKPFI